MKLSTARQGVNYTIKNIIGSRELIQHLHDLGFIAGAPVTIVSKSGENIIVKIKGSTTCIGKELSEVINVKYIPLNL